jgi:hypothetical protein
MVTDDTVDHCVGEGYALDQVVTNEAPVVFSDYVRAAPVDIHERLFQRVLTAPEV